jgi:hypothetical protein
LDTHGFLLRPSINVAQQSSYCTITSGTGTYPAAAG